MKSYARISANIMTLRNIALIGVGIALTGSVFCACNSDYETDSMTASSTAVKSFSLSKNDSIAARLDSVFFSIDLAKGLIFNADSLPYGTDVSRLVPVISTLDYASAVELIVKKANGSDTTHNYLENSTDTIDFTNPVKLRVVSYDGLYEYVYTVNVNVHKMVSDSLTWLPEHCSELPSALSAPTAQRTARSGNTFYCLTAEGSGYSLSTCVATDAPVNGPGLADEDWTSEKIDLPFSPQIESFCATSGALYLLSADGTLYSSADRGKSWSDTGSKFHALYGTYNDELLGSAHTADGWSVLSYPSGVSATLPANMPVEGASMPVYYTFPMSGALQMAIVGGRKADGTLTADAWGYDGSAWAALTKRAVPEPLEDAAVAMYYSFINSWNHRAFPSLVLFGGRKADGTLNRTVYLSNDYGVNWTKAADLMQLPESMPTLCGQQVFVADSYYSANISPKIVKPTETWTCPYIYMFGGYDVAGVFHSTLWRGTINRLSFRPIE